MISADQLRAARILLRIDQRALAERAGLSLPTIQRMEASSGVVRGSIDSLIKVMSTLEAAGITFIGEGERSEAGGRGVRFKAATDRRATSGRSSFSFAV